MVLNPNVLVAEADVAAKMGAVLNGTTLIYTVFGMTMTQAEFQANMNSSVNEEIALVGTDVYYTSDPVLNGMMKEYQINDCAYDILSGLPGRSATYFNFGSGDTRFDLQIGFIHEQAERFRTERDRTFNMVQNILSGGTMIDTNQPGYSQPSSPVY